MMYHKVEAGLEVFLFKTLWESKIIMTVMKYHTPNIYMCACVCVCVLTLKIQKYLKIHKDGVGTREIWFSDGSGNLQWLWGIGLPPSHIRHSHVVGLPGNFNMKQI